MEACCGAERPARERGCPGCGGAGRQVERITLKALLRPPALARMSETDHRFCTSASCDLVYFGKSEAFRRADVLVPVFQKETEGDRTVCYCFAVHEAEIRREVEATGRSDSAERIRGLVEAGQCACEVWNPQGGCCLGNVAVVMRAALGAIGPREEGVSSEIRASSLTRPLARR